MSTIDPHEAGPQLKPGQDFGGWLNEQLGAVKAQLGRAAQQSEQLQAAILDLNEKIRDNDAKVREITSRTMGLPIMQDQVRQLTGLLDRIQDTEVLIDTKFEMLERQLGERHGRDQAEKNDLYRRVQDLERRAESMHERQSGVDDAHRRFQEDVARTHLGAQGINQRLEAVESRAGRTLDAVTRLEASAAELESAIRSLRREDDVLAERARLAHEVAVRIESEMHAQAEEYRALPLLAERVELLRAERQRLEDRVSRAEESLADAVTRLEREEEASAQIDARLKSHDARIGEIHAGAQDVRRGLSDQLLKLNQMLERMKRRQVEEMERDIKDLRVQSNQLKNDEHDL
jgi:chromosome segregation ATPase